MKELEKNYISRGEAARMLGTTRQTISNWVERGLLEVRTSERCNNSPIVYISKESLDKFLDERKILSNELAIAEYDKECSRLAEELKQKKCELMERMKDLGLAEYSVNGVPYMLQVVSKIVDVLVPVQGKRCSTMVAQIINGLSSKEIAEKHNVTRECVRTVIYKYHQQIQELENYPTLLAQNEELKERCRELEAAVERLEKENLATKRYIEKSNHSLEEPIDVLLDENQKRLLNTRIVNCNLHKRTINTLKRARIETLGELLRYDLYQLNNVRALGKKSIEDVVRMVKELNLELGMLNKTTS